MSILNGDQILERIQKGDIIIDPFDEKKIGTNSYDICLYTILEEYITSSQKWFLDPSKKNQTKQNDSFSIDGYYILLPGKFILGATQEIVANPARDLVPMLEGRSSLARLGLSIHATAGFGDIGFSGRWTLELRAEIPIKLYPLMPIGQLYWIETTSTDRIYRGKYKDFLKPHGSELYQEYQFPEEFISR